MLRRPARHPWPGAVSILMSATLPINPRFGATHPVRRAARRTVEVVAVAIAVLFVASTASNTLAALALAVLVLVGAGAGVLFKRPSLIVAVAIGSLWFDNLGAGPIRTGRLMTALVLGVLALRIMTTDWRPPALQPRAWFPVGLFVFWATISGFWTAGFGTWTRGMFELLLGISYGLVFLLFLEDEPQMARGLKLFVWLGVPIALLSWFLYRGLQDTSKETGIENRTHGFTGNPNVYAFVLMAAVPICVVFFRRSRSRWERLLYVGILCCLALALMASGSRAGLLAMGAMAMYVFVTLPGLDRRTRLRSAVAGTVFVIVGVLVAGIVNPERFSLAGFFGDAGAGRLELWNAAVRTFGLHPVQGSGIGGFRAEIFDIMSKVPGTLDITRNPVNRDAKELEAHNLYLSLLLDMGIIGLAIWSFQYLSVARNLWDLRKHPAWRDWVWALGGTHLCTLVTAAFGSSYNMKFSWTIIGFSGAMYVRAVQAPRQRPGTALEVRTGPPALRPERPSRTGAAPMDLRLGVPFRRVLVCGAVLGGLLAGVGTALFSTPQYRTSAMVLVVNLDDNADARKGVQITDGRIQAVLALARSDPFLAEVQRRARLDRPVEDLARIIDSTRPEFSSLIRIDAVTPDRAEAERISRVLLGALDATVDAYRAGAISLSGIDGRAISPDVSPDYRGPIYLRLWDLAEVIDAQPRMTQNVVVGAVAAALLVFMGSMLMHGRPRLSRGEDVSALLGIPLLAGVPAPRRGAFGDATAVMQAAVERIDANCPNGANVVTLSGPGSASLRARVATRLALSLAALGDRPVVLVDLEGSRRHLSKRLGARRGRGWTDVVATHAGDGSTPTDEEILRATRPVRRLRVGWSVRRLAALHGSRVRLLSFGSAEPSRDPAEIGRIVASLARWSTVVVNLDRVPGPLPVGGVVEAADANLLVTLDGWTETEPARVSAEALVAAAPGRVGLMVIDQ